MKALELLILSYVEEALGDPAEAVEKGRAAIRNSGETVKGALADRAAATGTDIDDAVVEAIGTYVDDVVAGVLGEAQ